MEGLFTEPTRTAEPPPPAFTPGERRRHRQVTATLLGQHPLSLALRVPIPLHTDAAPAEPRDAAGLRCGGCRHREQLGHHTRSYPKCALGAIERTRTVDGKPWTWREFPRTSNGEGTDVAAWWPACIGWEGRA